MLFIAHLRQSHSVNKILRANRLYSTLSAVVTVVQCAQCAPSGELAEGAACVQMGRLCFPLPPRTLRLTRNDAAFPPTSSETT